MMPKTRLPNRVGGLMYLLKPNKLLRDLSKQFYVHRYLRSKILARFVDVKKN